MVFISPVAIEEYCWMLLNSSADLWGLCVYTVVAFHLLLFEAALILG